MVSAQVLSHQPNLTRNNPGELNDKDFSVNNIGPDLQHLLRRISATPADFLDDPKMHGRGDLAVAALVHDILRQVGHQATVEQLQRFIGSHAEKDHNRLRLVALAIWVLNDEWFKSTLHDADALLSLLDKAIQQLADVSTATKYINDSDRREEFARFLLARLDYRPAGESITQATDRLSALSTTERNRLLQESRAAEARARAIREALAKQAAAESADKWTRE